MSDQIPQDAGWFVAGVSTVIAVLAGVVSTLFKLNETKNGAAITSLQVQVDSQRKLIDASETRNDECERDRIRLSVEVAVIKEHVEALKSHLSTHIQRNDGNKP